MAFYVYGLIDPRNGELRYVGKASDMRRRLYHHMTPDSLKEETHRSRWLRQLKSAGIKPEMFAIEEHTTEAECFDAERDLIAYFRAIGCRLTNSTDGGEGMSGFKMPRDGVERRAASRRGRKLPPEVIAKMSASKRGKPSPKRGRPAPITDKVRAAWARLSELQSGERNHFYGRRHSDETRAKIKAALTGKESKNTRAVVDENGNTYGSIREAARAFGVTVATMCSALRGHAGRRRAVRGVGVAYVGESIDVRPVQHRPRKCKQVATSDGRSFASVKSAAAGLGVTVQSVSQAIRRGGKAGGVSVRFAED